MRYTKHGLCGKCGVYLITNTVNGKRYIGSSVNVGARIGQHFTGACRKYKDRLDFYADIDRYGRDAFSYEMLEECSPEAKIEREAFWYERLQPEYNLIRPTDAPFLETEVRRRAVESILDPEKQARLNAIKQTEKYRNTLREAQRFKMRSCRGINDLEESPWFDSITDAARWVVERTGKSRITVVNKIKACLDGTRPSAYGFRWISGGDANG